MKKVTFISAIAITLTSTTALAERGSDELNEIIQASSSANYSAKELHLTPDDLVLINGGAAKNSVLEPSSEPDSNDNELTVSKLYELNR
mgnify:CR=1 FL=1